MEQFNTEMDMLRKEYRYDYLEWIYNLRDIITLEKVFLNSKAFGFVFCFQLGNPLIN